MSYTAIVEGDSATPTFMNAIFDELDIAAHDPAVFTGAVTVAGTLGVTGVSTFSTNVNLSSANPQLVWIETDQAADNQRWDAFPAATQLQMRVVNDANTVASAWVTVDRTGTTIDTVAFPGTAVTMAGTLAVTGTSTLTGVTALLSDTSIAATGKFYFDGVGGVGVDTYIHESSADVLDFVVGTATMLKLTEAATDTAAFTADSFTVSGTGPHAIGGAVNGKWAVSFTGSFTGDGSGIDAAGLICNQEITGAPGDTSLLTGVWFADQIVTQTATETVGIVSQVYVNEPAITDNLTGDITVAASLYIATAPTEGVTNAALYVASGATHLDGLLEFKQQDSNLGAQADDFDIATSGIQRFTSTGAQNISGFAGGVDGSILFISNADSADAISLLHQSTSSVATNRMSFPGGVSRVVAAGAGTILYYDGSSSRWRPLTAN